jgi:hypothetical protein
MCDRIVRFYIEDRTESPACNRWMKKNRSTGEPMERVAKAKKEPGDF